jgi:hypothetical protein
VSADFQPTLLVEKMDALLRDPARLAAEAEALQKRAQGLFSLTAHLEALRTRLQLPVTRR